MDPSAGNCVELVPVNKNELSVTYFFPTYHGPGVDSPTSENEYHEHFLGVKAVGA